MTAKKIETCQSVLAGRMQGAMYAAMLANKGKGGAGKKKAKSKKKYLIPPIAGWKGGNPDNNGIKASETYGDGKKMPLRETTNRHKVGR